MDRTTSTPQFQLEQNRSSMAMLVAYVSWSMLFATLFLGYTVYRFSETSWPPNGFERISLLWPGLSTLVITLSSLSFIQTRKFYIAKNRSGFKNGLIITLLLGLCFIAVQFVLWDKLAMMGLYVSAGIFPSILHAFTWIHVGHIVCALLAMLWLFTILREDKFLKNKIIAVKNVENFWHFLGVVWLIMFVFLFVV